MDDDKSLDDDAKVALEHAWDWFALHATQRLQSINFFLIATTFLSAAFVTAAKEKMYVLAGGVAVLAVCMSYFFYRLERRIRTLIHASESALAPLQDRLASTFDVDELRIVKAVEADRPGEWKYSKVFRYLFVVTAAAFTLGLTYSVWIISIETTNLQQFNSVLQAILGIALIVFAYEMLFGITKSEQVDRSQAIARYLLITIGATCGVSGLVIVIHLIFFRL